MASLAVWYPDGDRDDRRQFRFSTDQTQAAVMSLNTSGCFPQEFCTRDSKQHAEITDCQCSDFRKPDFSLQRIAYGNQYRKGRMQKDGNATFHLLMQVHGHNAYMLERFICVFNIQPDTTLIKKTSKQALFTAQHARHRRILAKYQKTIDG